LHKAGRYLQATPAFVMFVMSMDHNEDSGAYVVNTKRITNFIQKKYKFMVDI
jgi:hypothetical protein